MGYWRRSCFLLVASDSFQLDEAESLPQFLTIHPHRLIAVGLVLIAATAAEAAAAETVAEAVVTDEKETAIRENQS